MIFSELYSAYYETVAEILRQAAKDNASERELRHAVNDIGETVAEIHC